MISYRQNRKQPEWTQITILKNYFEIYKFKNAYCWTNIWIYTHIYPTPIYFFTSLQTWHIFFYIYIISILPIFYPNPDCSKLLQYIIVCPKPSHNL